MVQDGKVGPTIQETSYNTTKKLAAIFVARYLAFLPKAQFPIRYGMHSNSAFGLAFALGYFRSERLAIIELRLPMTIVFLFISRQSDRGWRTYRADRSR